MKKRRIFYLQLALEASIPLMGFFLWDWGLYFILLFYILDMLASEVIVHFKSVRIYKFKETQERLRLWLKLGVLSLIVFFAALALMHVAMMAFHPQIDFTQEIIKFWNYEDLGIKQGYLFVPLIFVMNWQQFKMEFIYTAKYRTLDMKTLWKEHMLSNTMVAVGAFLSWGLLQLIVPNELVFIVGLIIGIVIFRLVRKY